MVIILDLGRDFTLADEVEDGGADLRHGDDTWTHDAELAGCVGEHVVLVVAREIWAVGDFTW